MEITYYSTDTQASPLAGEESQEHDDNTVLILLQSLQLLGT